MVPEPRLELGHNGLQPNALPIKLSRHMVELGGFEPPSLVPKTRMIGLNYTTAL